ncbi:hypothetical protein K1W54_02310 [Micromonospora sp. CPCC 205371]|nr:hypothetical protein [Micromonospora sp. CPCC 205371]
MRQSLRLVLASAGAAAGLVASLLTAAGPARAYSPNPGAAPARLAPDTWPRPKGPLPAVRRDAACFLDDEIDYTLFQYDADAVAVKIEMHVGGSMVGKVEFHPYDEVFWIYDTRDDGDAIYVTVCRITNPDNPLCQAEEGPWTAGGDDAVDVSIIDRDYPDGQAIRISVWDNENATDLIGRYGGIP